MPLDTNFLPWMSAVLQKGEHVPFIFFFTQISLYLHVFGVE